MPWSEQIGATIRLPSDAVELGGAPYIDIGEEVPSEIADYFRAAVFFQSGERSGAVGASVIYWALGITQQGSLELVAFVGHDATMLPDGTEQFTTSRQTMLSLYRAGSTAGELVLEFGGINGTYDEYPPIIRTSSTIRQQNYGRQRVSYRAGWSDRASTAPLAFYQLPDGMILVSGYTNVGTGATAVIADISGTYLPKFGNEGFAAASSAGPISMEVTAGLLRIVTGTVPAGGWVAINATYPGQLYDR